jgi:hypothetical protein
MNVSQGLFVVMITEKLNENSILQLDGGENCMSYFAE